MDPKIPSQSSPPSDSHHGGGATFLSNLPSRGLFSSTPSSIPGGMRVYICDHDTSPPESQHIKTDQMNILIRSLLIKKHGHVDAISRKRAATDKSSSGSADSRSSVKRVATGSVDSLQSLTVERLRMMLREKGLSVKGKKDELVARLRSANG